MKLKFNFGYLYLLVYWHRGSCIITEAISTTITKYIKETDHFFWINGLDSMRDSSKKL